MQLFVLLFVSVVGVKAFSVSKVDGFKGKPCGLEASPNLIHHNPWMVFLEYYQNDVRSTVRCGGTLIGSRHVITAAHCVKKFSYTRLVARLGEYDLDTSRDCVEGVCADAIVSIDVVNFHVPPTFDGSGDDIAILELETDAPYTDFIRPICLPTEELQEGTVFSAAGWGEESFTHIYSNIKKIIPLPFWSDEKCRTAYKNLKIPSKIICAGGEEGMDTCRGDSGGPLTLNKGWVELWGVTSSGNVRCGTKGYPGIYTSVVEHLEWIQQVLSVS